MSSFTAFMKKNKKARKNVFYAATKSITDENGNPVEWEIRPLTTEEDERIRIESTHEVPVPGKKGLFRDKVNVNEYMDKQMVAAIVFPDLSNAELQDSYGVKTPEALLKQLVDDPSEYADLRTFIQESSGFSVEVGEEVEEAKN
jgi:hypothetical protein